MIAEAVQLQFQRQVRSVPVVVVSMFIIRIRKGRVGSLLCVVDPICILQTTLESGSTESSRGEKKKEKGHGPL